MFYFTTNKVFLRTFAKKNVMEKELLTVTEYCQKRKVSKQFVYEYIRKGKLFLLELPIFVEYEGKKHEVGTKKFVKPEENKF